MQDYLASLEQLRRDAANAASIRDRAAEDNKRELFDRLHRYFNQLADEVERALNGPNFRNPLCLNWPRLRAGPFTSSTSVLFGLNIDD